MEREPQPDDADRNEVDQREPSSEDALDHALEDTFPASDPVAAETPMP